MVGSNELPGRRGVERHTARPQLPKEAASLSMFKPRKLPFEEGITDEDAFDLLPPRVQQKLWPNSDVSALKVWWANRFTAGVLRKDQLGVAMKGQDGWRVWAVALQPDSHIRGDLELPAPPGGHAGPTTGGPATASAPLVRQPWDRRWPADFAGFLGNMPIRAQEMLSNGFAHNTVRPEHAWAYRLKHPAGEYDNLEAQCVLVDLTQAVVMHGTRWVPKGLDDPFAPGPAPWTVAFYTARRKPKPRRDIQTS